MKNVLFKRAFAFLVDVFLSALMVEGTAFFLSARLLCAKSNWRLLIVLFLLSCKDLVFRNASIGKKVLGLVIFDDEWSKPSLVILWKRFVWLCLEGFYLIWKAMHIDGNYTVIFQAEYSRLKTRVVEKKVYKRLLSMATTKSGFDPIRMTRLYEEYINSKR